MATPFAGTQAPGFYRHKVGSYEVTVVSDGTLTLDATIFTGDEAGAEKLLRDAHLPKMGFTTPLNTWLINTGQKLILVDAGGGIGFDGVDGEIEEAAEFFRRLAANIGRGPERVVVLVDVERRVRKQHLVVAGDDAGDVVGMRMGDDHGAPRPGDHVGAWRRRQGLRHRGRKSRHDGDAG